MVFLCKNRTERGHLFFVEQITVNNNTIYILGEKNQAQRTCLYRVYIL